MQLNFLLQKYCCVLDSEKGGGMPATVAGSRNGCASNLPTWQVGGLSLLITHLTTKSLGQGPIGPLG